MSSPQGVHDEEKSSVHRQRPVSIFLLRFPKKAFKIKTEKYRSDNRHETEEDLALEASIWQQTYSVNLMRIRK